MPSSEMLDGDRANRIQQIDLELSRHWNTNWKANQKAYQTLPPEQYTQTLYNSNIISNPELRDRVQKLVNERHAHKTALSEKLFLRHWDGIGPWFKSTFRFEQTAQEEVLEFHNFKEYEIGRGSDLPYPLEHNFYKDYTLRLKNMFPAPTSPFNEDNRDLYLKARLQCNSDIIYKANTLFAREKRDRVYSFNWYYNRINGQNVKIKFTSAVNTCELFFFDPDKSKTWTHSLKMVNLAYQSSEWIRLTNQIELCAIPQGSFRNKVQKFFWSEDYNFMTCPYEAQSIINLRDPYESINRKVISLTGSPLSRKDFNEQNPMTALNFSKAPHFDVIWVSSLNFSADFFGLVMARALRHHAEKGTQIRILVPEVTITKKDKQILENLRAGTPNVKIQYYKYSLTNSDNGGWIDKFHRVNHTKIVMGYSASKPKDSFYITGGRNIRDSYIFRRIPAYKAYKFLKNYSAGEESYIYYDDFELEMRGQDFVRAVTAQMLSFWMRESQTHRFRSTNINIPQFATASETQRLEKLSDSKPLVKHIVSLPYFDNFQLEKYYITLINSAEKELLLTTPYFRPSVAISEALDKAVQRGVKVAVLTRIHLAGDGVPSIAEDVNKQGINRHLSNVDIYEWIDPHSIMHAKLLIIDGELSFVSSVNLNRRSFIHDIENGALILSKSEAKELRKEFFEYLKKGKRITAAEKISWINGTLIDWADSYF